MNRKSEEREDLRRNSVGRAGTVRKFEFEQGDGSEAEGRSTRALDSERDPSLEDPFKNFP